MIYLPKSHSAPSCLEIEKKKNNGTYRCDGVYTQIQNDFKNKCYICELKAPTTINIEHFKPHRGDKNLEFDWENLFFSCGHCNSIKLAKDIFDDILNCILEPDVDKKIKYSIDPFPKMRVEISAMDENSDKVQNTVELLKQVYSGTTERSRMESDNLRSIIKTEIENFNELLIVYIHESNCALKEKYKREIISHLQSDSCFTAFKRWIVRENEDLIIAFNKYI